ncbi:MAG: RecX family transcriptional regulator [Bacteroides sp.]|nr:RecX family transcriptional regulator [Bacteroides sp.]
MISTETNAEMSLFDEEEKELEYSSEYSRARKRAMYLLGSRDYSSAGLKEKLLGSYSEETAERVIEDMKRYGYLNDEEYARKLAASLIVNKKYGLYRAKSEMRRRGVEEAAAEEALSAYEKEDYSEQLVLLIQKKYYDKIQDRDDRRRTVSALVRRGYGFSEIKEAVLTVLEQQAEEET